MLIYLNIVSFVIVWVGMSVMSLWDSDIWYISPRHVGAYMVIYVYKTDTPYMVICPFYVHIAVCPLCTICRFVIRT